MSIPRFEFSFPTILGAEHLALADLLENPAAIDLQDKSEREARQRCWKLLLSWWLLNRIEKNKVGLAPPLLDFFPKHANGSPVFRDLVWLGKQASADSAVQWLGVESPFTFVRLVPDFDATQIEWRNDLPSGQEEREVNWLASHLVGSIGRALESNPSPAMGIHLENLRAILQKHFPNAESEASDPRAYENVTVTLKTLHGLESIPIPITRKGIATARPTFAPMCHSCRTPSFPSRPVEIGQGVATCSWTCASCGNTVSLSLSGLHCGWIDDATLGYWTDVNSGTVSWEDASKANGDPPVPEKIGGRELRFRFESARLPALAAFAADPEIVLCIPPGSELRELRKSSTFFKNLIHPGLGRLPANVQLLPVRLEAADLCTNKVVWEEDSSRLTTVVRLKGLPSGIRIPFLNVDRAQASGIALFPDPARLPAGWNWFRAVTSEGYRLRGCGSTATDPEWFLETTDAFSPLLEWTKSADDTTGCTLRVETQADRSTETFRARFAVDFGTVSSVVAWKRLRDGAGTSSALFKPWQLRAKTAWLARADNGELAEKLLDRLLPREAINAEIVPSEICEHLRLHWHSEICCADDSKIQVLFKGLEGREKYTEGYLLDLLRHAVADSLTTAAGPVPASATIETTFSYPLTFSEKKFKTFQEVAKRALALLEQQTGIKLAPAVFIDESTAGVHATGTPQGDRWIVVADLGGGTLDVSMGQGTTSTRFWIGSLEAGGSHLLQALVGGKDWERPEFKQAQRHIRSGDARASELLDTEREKQMMNHYLAALFFYLETLMTSCIQSADATGSPVIEIHLLGRGWSYLDLAYPENPAAASSSYFNLRRAELEETLRHQSGRDNLTVEIHRGTGNEDVLGAKRAVALGALDAGVPEANAPVLARLPLGIGIHLPGGDSRTWSLPIGPAAPLGSPVDNRIKFGWKELGERIAISGIAESQSYPNRSQEARDAPLRTRFIDRENRAALPGAEALGTLERGSLQLLLESFWIKEDL